MKELLVVLVGQGGQLGNPSPRARRAISFRPTSLSTSLETPPRVIPMRSARTPGEVSSPSNISRITTHSATVTPLARSLRAKACET